MVANLILATLPAFAEVPLPPFAGDYALFRNGREVGSAHIEYGPADDGRWRIRSHLKASVLGGTLRFTASEESHVSFLDGEPRSEQFSGRREQPFRHREQHLRFDWQRAEVMVRDSRRGESWHDLPGPTLDPLAALLRAALAAQRGEKSFEYYEVNRGAPKRRRGNIVGPREERLGTGKIRCILVERLSEDPDRQSASCHAPTLGYAPVLIRYADDGEELVLRLRSGPASD